MFTGTLRFNLDPSNSVKDSEIVYLLEQAGLHKYIESDGLDSHISEGGVNMSSGEK